MLGTPLGHREFVEAQLRAITAEHQVLLNRIPHVTDLQCAWLLLLFCAASRPNYVLRVVHPDATREFAAQHDEDARRCLGRLLGLVLPDAAWNLATLPLNLGSLGLRSAIRGRPAAFFASWADGLEMINKRHPSVPHLILNDLTQDRPSHHLSVLVQAKGRLADVGFHPPSWTALAEGERPGGGDVEDGGPGMPRHGWQREAAEKMEDFFLATSVWPRLPDEDRAMLRSQGGPMTGLPFMCCPTAFHSRFDAQVLRVLLLRRLWLPSLDVLGHHRAACANVGVLGRRGFALESAAARVCREWTSFYERSDSRPRHCPPRAS